VTRQQLRLPLRDFSELAFEGFGDTAVKRASGFAQQRAIGCILHQGMLEQVGRMRWSEPTLDCAGATQLSAACALVGLQGQG
jgi:hypothetical protein